MCKKRTGSGGGALSAGRGGSMLYTSEKWQPSPTARRIVAIGRLVLADIVIAGAVATRFAMQPVRPPEPPEKPLKPLEPRPTIINPLRSAEWMWCARGVEEGGTTV
jgi:hypothetical protein